MFIEKRIAPNPKAPEGQHVGSTVLRLTNKPIPKKNSLSNIAGETTR